MPRHDLRSIVLLVALATVVALGWECPLFAQGNRRGLSPQDQQKYDELIRSAQTNEMIGYIAAGVGILFVVVAIPLGIYLDRRKKARQKAMQQGPKTPDTASSPPRSGQPET
jgi:hypothetical protein